MLERRADAEPRTVKHGRCDREIEAAKRRRTKSARIAKLEPLLTSWRIVKRIGVWLLKLTGHPKSTTSSGGFHSATGCDGDGCQWVCHDNSVSHASSTTRRAVNHVRITSVWFAPLGRVDNHFGMVYSSLRCQRRRASSRRLSRCCTASSYRAASCGSASLLTGSDRRYCPVDHRPRTVRLLLGPAARQ